MLTWPGGGVASGADDGENAVHVGEAAEDDAGVAPAAASQQHGAAARTEAAGVDRGGVGRGRDGDVPTAEDQLKRVEIRAPQAGLVRESQTSLAYYVARIALPDEELKRLGDLKLVPGMPAEVQIRTSDRTALPYFIKPQTDQLARAFKGR